MESVQVSVDAATAIALVPRRGPALPSPNGTYYVVTETQYDAEVFSQTMITKLWKTGTSEPYFALPQARKLDPDSICWLNASVLLWAEPAEDWSPIYTLDAEVPSQMPYHVCSLPGDCSQIRIQTLHDGRVIIGFVSSVGEDVAGSHTSPLRSGGSGQLYTKLPVRWLSDYCAAEAGHTRRRSVFYVEIQHMGDAASHEWELSEPEARPRHVLEGTGLLLPPWASDPFAHATRQQALRSPGKGELRDFLVTAVPSAVDTGRTWTHGLYCVSIPAVYPAKPARQCTSVQPRGWTGMPESVSVSASGKYAAFIQWKRPDACFDHGTIFVVHMDALHVIHPVNLTRNKIVALCPLTTHPWNPRIVSIQWSRLTDNVLYATIEDRGKIQTWKLEISLPCQDDRIDAAGDELTGVATQLSCEGCVISMVPFVTDHGVEKLMITRSDFDTAWVAEVIDTQGDTFNVHRLDDLRLPPEASLQAHHQSIIYPVGTEYCVQAFVHMPMERPKSPSHAYPLVVLIHGGPNDAHRDSWTPNWNPCLWTSRGFVVITPNISGSVGFGLSFAQAIFRNWSGRPHSDIVALLDWLARNNNTLFDGCVIDTGRMLCCGYSFGGYLVNWIAGHPDAASTLLKFRALIVHGGVFSTNGLLGSDLPLAYADDFGGFPWENSAAKKAWRRWDPSRFAENWTIPMLFTHGHKDFRVPLTEALAAFQVCQNRGVPSELLIFMDEAHSLRKPANRIQWQRKLVEWSMTWTSARG